MVTDRAKYFVSEFAEEMSANGCYFDTSARASPWQSGQTERYGGLWKDTIKRIIWSDQLAGYNLPGRWSTKPRLLWHAAAA